jgi:hypothetical protein
MKTFLLAAALVAAQLSAAASQIGPLGSSFEATLTNEKEDTLATIAGRLGVLIKSPVHEEITQLGFGCSADTADLLNDFTCAGRDRPFVSPYVIYGVRWNDLPPFRLSQGEGQQCKKLLSRAPACRTDQTIRFATQPECWLCLFRDAEKTAQQKRIEGCSKDRKARGNLMTRSHFGDLQFLHAMASAEGEPAAQTQSEVLGWIEFAWRVFSREVPPEKMLRDIDIPLIKERFGCSELSVADIYILGRNDKLRQQLHSIAFGSILHTVQDSFSAAHAEREAAESAAKCPANGVEVPKPGRVKEFHTYGAQDGHLHDLQDQRAKMASNARDRRPDAIEMTRAIFALYDTDPRPKWREARPLFDCIFELSLEPSLSSPGRDYKRP